MGKTRNHNVAILLTGYNNNKGYSDIISCSDETLEQEIRNQDVSLKDFRYSLNIIAESEQIYSIGFTKNWKVYSIYEAYGWSARKVMIGLSLFIRKGSDLESNQKNNIKEILDHLKKQYIKIVNYQLEGVVQVDESSVAELSVQSERVINGAFHTGYYAKGKEGKGHYKYTSETEVNNIFSQCYASELQGYREVYLINQKVQYIEALVPALPAITPKPTSKAVSVIFHFEGAEIPAYKISGQILINGAPPPNNLLYEVKENGTGIRVEINDKKYEQVFPVNRTADELLAQDSNRIVVNLREKLYSYTLKCVEKGTNTPIHGLVVEVKYERDGRPVKEEMITGITGQITLGQYLKYEQSISFTPLKYQGTDKNKKFDPKQFRTINERVEAGRNEYKLVLEPVVEKPKAKPPVTTKNRTADPSSHTKPPVKPSVSGDRIVFKLEPPEAQPQPQNLDVKYQYSGQILDFKSENIQINGNVITLTLPADCEKIFFDIKYSKNYELAEKVVLDSGQISSYTSNRLKERTIHLTEKKQSSFLSSILNRRVLLLTLVLIALIVAGLIFIPPLFIEKTSVNISELIEKKKKEYKVDIEILDKDLKERLSVIDSLLSEIGEINKGVEKNGDTINTSQFSQQMDEKINSANKIIGRIKGEVNLLNEKEFGEDTTKIDLGFKSLNDLNSALHSIKEDLDQEISKYNREAIGKAAEKEAEMTKVRAEFKTYFKYIYGSLEDNKYLKNYATKIETNTDRFLNAGIDKDEYYNTLSLARKRMVIKDHRFKILCFIDKATCKDETKAKITNFDELKDQLISYINDKGALTPSQRNELIAFLEKYSLYNF
jgi:hypothetical protein